MLLESDFDSFFVRTMKALESYLDDILCVGGCANALYRYHESASEMAWGYLGTKDIDIAVPQKLPTRERAPIAGLMEEAGFKENPRARPQF